MLIINSVIKTAALWITFLWFATVLIRKPLTTFAAAAQKVNLETLSTGKVQIDTPGNNEIKALERSFNTMIDNLHESMVERERVEKNLRDSEEKYRIMAKRTGQMVYDYELRSGAIEWSGAIEEITGFTPDEFSDVNFEQWARNIHEEDRNRAVSMLKEAMDRETVFCIEYRFKCKDGSFVPIEDSGIFLKNESGDSFRVLGNMKDISERQQMEERLRHSQKMDAIGQLAGGIAHDFNNQLAGVFGGVDLLSPRLEDEKSRRFLEYIAKAATRARDLTMQLLAFSRKGKNIIKHVKVHDILRETVEILKRSIDKRIEIVENFKATPDTTLGDPTQLQNALLNLAINARDAMPDGGVLRLETSVIQLDSLDNPPYEMAPGSFIRVCVSDNGTGMTQEVEQRIFEPFFTTKPLGKGTGMGLASVFGTIRNHKGSISVDTEPGKGTTFNIYLPLTISEVENHSGSARDPVKGSGHIMIVDDEEIVCDVGTEMLQCLGYTVTSFDNGVDALAHFGKDWRDVDLVILDINMPKMNGKEVFRAMRKINPSVRVLVASGHSADGDAQTIVDEGAHAFIGKPFTLESLSKAIADVFGEE